ncbi:FAD-dependent oxidoreductase [Streptomyces antnestii]|uniref:FAD-dependent oxidoreductase n=1 Tax=Streptomyces antnestii TaxID=2494256 RepID=A0A437PNQ7_9ACTN|nr:FAD-dependent oxidoreductase [Streptomyces sp. San01]RVU23921.1 FAD-dependent oxidoreductase [Streptomyces sp. San01]
MTDPNRTDRRELVIVGASLAGLRAAQALRAERFTGTITVVGDEPRPPYDRPPLSKQLLTADARPTVPELPVPDGLDVRWQLGCAAVALAPDTRTLTLADGTTLTYDGLLIATGSTARRWPAPLPPHVLTLRGWDDTLVLRDALATARRLLVVGAGFLGGEVAAAARTRGLDVTLVEASAQPLQRALGTDAGAYVAALHRESGIDLRTSTTVEEFRTHDDGQLAGALLSDGSYHPADAAVLALGSLPATDWLTGSGLDAEGGVRCDPYLRALRPDGTPFTDVTVAGDAARAPHPLADHEPIVLGHWTNAVEQAATAARTLLHPDPPRPSPTVPSFWSDLHGAAIRSVGLPSRADAAEVIELDVIARKLEVVYHRRGRLVGALTAGRPGRLATHHRHLQQIVDAATRQAAAEAVQGN